MSLIDDIKKLNGNEKIVVLIRNSGIYEQYEDYCLKSDANKLKRLQDMITDQDALPEFTADDFVEYYEDRQYLLDVHRQGKIIRI